MNQATHRLVAALHQKDATGLLKAIAAGADLTVSLGPSLWTPFHKACADGWLAGAEILLSVPGFNPDERVDGLRDPLILAAPHGLVFVQLLLRAGLSTYVKTLEDMPFQLPECDRSLWGDLRKGR